MSFAEGSVESGISDSISFNLIMILTAEKEVWARGVVEHCYPKKGHTNILITFNTTPGRNVGWFNWRDRMLVLYQHLYLSLSGNQKLILNTTSVISDKN